MKVIDIHYSFLSEIDKLDTVHDVPSSDDIEYWFNAAILKFIKNRFTGNNILQQSVEQSEKRIEDLRMLVTDRWYKSPSELVLRQQMNGTYDMYVANMPDDLMFVLGENVIISNKDMTKRSIADVFECTSDNLTSRMKNRLTDFHYHNGHARPLRVVTGNMVQLYTDQNYILTDYQLRYIKMPCKLNLNAPILEEYVELSDQALREVIQVAVAMYLENKKSERYQSIQNELATQE